MKISLHDIQSTLPLPATKEWPEGVWDAEAFADGKVSLILFAPRGKDYQTAHDQDELYIIVSGSGELHVEGTVESFLPGDVLFVPAHKDHHFENFSNDLITWAVFWNEPLG